MNPEKYPAYEACQLVEKIDPLLGESLNLPDPKAKHDVYTDFIAMGILIVEENIATLRSQLKLLNILLSENGDTFIQHMEEDVKRAKSFFDTVKKGLS